MELSRRSIALTVRPALFLSLLCGGPASARPEFGLAVDDFCTSNARTPPQPYRNDCAICHNPSNKDLDRTPGFDAYRNRDFDYFCPPAPANQPPVLGSIGDQMVIENVLLALLVVASDPEGAPVRLEASDLPTGATFQDNLNGTADFAWRPGFDQAGNYPVLFRATDSASPPAIASERVIITVGDVNRPPVLDPIGNQAVDAGRRLVLVLGASDPDLDVVRFAAAGLPAGAELLDLGNGSAEFSWLTTAQDVGNTEVTFTVTDSGAPMGSDSEAIIVTVGAVNRPPALAPIGNQRVAPGETLALAIMADDPDGDGVRLSVEGLPDGADFADVGDRSARLSWTPRVDQLGNYTLTCTATDDGVPPERDIETFTVTVGAVNRPPILDPFALLEEGDVLVIRLTARDLDGDALGFAAAGVPSGASFLDHRNGTAEFRWQPPAGLAGDFTLVFTVTDDGVPSESASGQSVISLAPAPVTSAPAAPAVNRVSRNLRCGLGFELAFLLPPLMWLRRRRRDSAGRFRSG